MSKNTPIEEFVLVTLSFFEPMTISKIILDFDNEKLAEFPGFDKEQLQEIINQLEKKKFIARVAVEKENGWIRIQRKRSFLQIIRSYF